MVLRKRRAKRSPGCMRLKHWIASMFTLLGVAGNAWASSYEIHSDVVGEVRNTHTREEDNLYGLARKFNLGIVEMLTANPQIDDLWMPGEGTKLTLPTEYILPPVRSGIVVNLPELRLYYFAGNTVYTFPVGIGKEGNDSPIGESRVTKLRKDPVWIVPDSIRKEKPELPARVEPGPDNPMGAYAMNTGWKSVVIHGTNSPNGIGLRSSHGCIRMYPEDIEKLFSMVKVGTKITFMNTPYKLGWRGNDLYLEVTPTQDQLDTIVHQETTDNPDLPEVRMAVKAAAEKHKVDVDWYAVDTAIHERNSLPVVIASKSKAVQESEPEPVADEVVNPKPKRVEGILGTIRIPVQSNPENKNSAPMSDAEFEEEMLK